MIIKELYQICNKIQSESSTLAKKEILKSEINNESFRTLLKFLYDPMIITGISNSKINKVFADSKKSFSCKSFLAKTNINDNEPKFNDLFQLLDYISKNNTGRDSDIKVCQKFIETHTDSNELSDFVSSIITKSLKLGIDVRTVRDVYGKDFIYLFEVQNAYSYKDYKLEPNEWFCLSQKMNGNRAIYKDNELTSRQGKAFSGLNHIIDDLKKLQSNYAEDMVFDGEIMRRNIDNLPDNENFTIGTGILNADSGDKSILQYVIFDLLPKDEFEAGESKLVYSQRLIQMHYLDHYIKSQNLNNVVVVPVLYEGTDQKQIDICLNKMESEGKEGCMLARDVTYKCKRHSGLLKVKKFNTVDLYIVGYERGSGKYENTLGAILVDYLGNTVGVGSGFSDEQRDDIWNNRDDIIGKLVEVKYKDISINHSTGEKSLQFPVFVRFRDDKDFESLA